MRLWFSAIVRLLAVTATLLTALAVVIGRGRREPAGPGPGPAAGQERGRHGAVLDALDGGWLGVLDVETGAVERVPIPCPDLLRFAACSPWRDGSGRTQVIAQWWGRVGRDDWGVGLARFEIPGGKALDRVAMDIVPRGIPCWFPDGSARVLFGGGDGWLYHLRFEDRDGGPGRAAEDRASPLPVAWRIGHPAGGLCIADPTWPSHPQFADTVLATLIELEPGVPSAARRRPRLWWLRLGPRDMEVVAAGRLIEPDSNGPREDVAGEYLGSVSATSDGGLALAYLVRRPSSSEIRLRLAPLTIDPTTGAPRAREADAVELARGRAFGPPAFSKDGRWVYSFPRSTPAPDRAERSSVADALAARETRNLAARPLIARPAGAILH